MPADTVAPSLAIGQVIGHDTPDLNFVPSYESELTSPQWGPRDLSKDDRFTVALDDIFLPSGGATIVYADMAIVIRYEIPIIHLKQKKIFPFISRKQTNGKVYWYSKK